MRLLLSASSCGSKHLSDTHTHGHVCVLYLILDYLQKKHQIMQEHHLQRHHLAGENACWAREYFSRVSSIINCRWDCPRPVSRRVYCLLWDSSGHLPHTVLVWKLFQQDRAPGILWGSPAGFYFWGVSPEGWSWDFCFWYWIKSTLGIWKPSHIQSLPGMW